VKKTGERKRHNAEQLCSQTVPKDRFDTIWSGLPAGVRSKATAKDLAELVDYIAQLPVPRQERSTGRLVSFFEQNIQRAANALEAMSRIKPLQIPVPKIPGRFAQTLSLRGFWK
jgi:hypothetical protein